MCASLGNLRGRSGAGRTTVRAGASSGARYRSNMRALLVHGLSSSSASWWRIVPALERLGFEVSAIDLRGHGAAPRAASYELSGYASDLPDGDWDLVVGHSLGGATVVLAAQRPGFTRALVLLDPVLEVPAELFDEVLADQLAELDLDEESLAALKPHWHDTDRATKLAGIRATDATVVGRSITDNAGWNVVAETEALRMPTLIIGGDHAVYSMLATETAQAITRANPLVEYRVIPGAGHSPHRDKPEATLAALESWVRALR